MSGIEEYQWIFFSSPNSVKYFTESVSIPNNVKLGAVGEGTKKALENSGYFCDFCSIESDTTKIGIEFSKVVPGESVLFPQSDISRRTIPKALETAQVIDLVVYETRPKPEIKKQPEDFLVFTSPSNAFNYFSKYSLNNNQTVVAIGKTTEAALKQFTSRVIVSQAPTEIAIWNVIIEFIQTHSLR